MTDNLFISFSGGETSAYMTQRALEELAPNYKEVVVLFANTGQENEETLRFVEKCDSHFGFNVIWVEADVNPEMGKGTKFKIVNYETASRNGEPFEAVIQKYGIPNMAFPHCTRELKLKPMTSYMRSIGWKNGMYDTAIGIRADEVDRIHPNYKDHNFVYPMVTWGMTKPMVNSWWSEQPFRLNLKGYEGNCKWCWKKSMRKHLTLITEHPEWYDFPERMEAQYALAGTNKDNTPRVFFRGQKTTKDLRELAKTKDFEPATDDAQVMYDPQLDESNGCIESCEIDFTQAEELYQHELKLTVRCENE